MKKYCCILLAIVLTTMALGGCLLPVPREADPTEEATPTPKPTPEPTERPKDTGTIELTEDDFCIYRDGEVYEELGDKDFIIISPINYKTDTTSKGAALYMPFEKAKELYKDYKGKIEERDETDSVESAKIVYYNNEKVMTIERGLDEGLVTTISFSTADYYEARTFVTALYDVKMVQEGEREQIQARYKKWYDVVMSSEDGVELMAFYNLVGSSDNSDLITAENILRLERDKTYEVKEWDIYFPGEELEAAKEIYQKFKENYDFGYEVD